MISKIEKFCVVEEGRSAPNAEQDLLEFATISTDVWNSVSIKVPKLDEFDADRKSRKVGDKATDAHG